MTHHQGGLRDLCSQLLLIHLGTYYRAVSHQTESIMLFFLEFLSHLKERLAILEIYMINTETSSILSNLYENSDSGCSIRDCQRIGRYNSNSTRPRPMLAILSTNAEVRYVLTHRSSLPSSITIKPDRSSSERRVEKILLSKRWKLIQVGSDRRSIKISNSCLYLNGSLRGKVVNFTYSQVPFLGDLAPTLSNLSNISAPTGDDIQSPPSQTPVPPSSN